MRGGRPWLWARVLLAGLAQALSLAWPWQWGLERGTVLPWLQALSLWVLVRVLQGAPTARRAFWLGEVYAVAWLAGTFWWLFISMHTYGGLPAVLAAAAVLVLAAFLGVYYAAAAALFWRWRQAPVAAQALVFAALWTLAEWARATWFTGFPWGAGGYAQIDALAWLAPWVGVYGMGAVSAAVAALVAGAWPATRPSAKTQWRTKTGLFGSVLTVSLAAAVAACMVVPALGRHWAAVAPSWTVSTGRLPVTLLQGNIPQDEKFEPGSGVPLALDWYGRQIRNALAAHHSGPALVVAPETAIPLLPQEMDPAYWRDLLDAVSTADAALMLGLPLGNGQDGYTNSVGAWVPPQAGFYRYDKHHLVPFGEFIPPLFRWFTQMMNIPLGDFNRGGLAQPSLAWAGQRLAPNVCYEDLFGEELAHRFVDIAQAPTVLVNVSNLGWFGDSVAIDQHRLISRMRTLELQRPMLRATNTGSTAVIDHTGRVVVELPRLTRDVLTAEVEGRSGTTPYAYWAGRWGLWPLVVCCVAVLLLVWMRGRATGV